MYADFDFYVNTFLGDEIAAEDFNRLMTRATVLINTLTFGRAVDETIDPNLSLIKHAACAVAEELNKNQGRDGALLAEKVGQLSITYRDSTSAAQSTQIRNAAKLYLSETGLMFGGLD